MNRSQSKYFNTALLMDEALILLLEKKDFEFITIKEICAKAGVNRSTFYLHYENINDLIKECGNYLNKKFIDKYKGKEELNIETNSLNDLYLVDDKFLIPYLNFVKENKTFYCVVCKNPGIFGTVDQFNKLTKTTLMPIINRFGINENDGKYYLEFFIKGIIAVVMKWVDSGCVDDVNHIALIINSCNSRDDDKK
jgi:hypothetical protein